MGEYTWFRWLVAAAIAATLGTSATTVEAQRRPHRRAPTPTLEQWRTVLDATEALAAVNAEPGDASGQVRAWDRRWRARLERLRDRWSMAHTGCSRYAECRRRAGCELTDAVHTGASRVLDARRSIYQPQPGILDDRPPLVALASSFAWRRLVMMTALARAQERLSCEDLPDRDELRRRLGPGCEAAGLGPCNPTPFVGPYAEVLADTLRSLARIAGSAIGVRDIVHLLLLVARDQVERLGAEAARLVEAHRRAQAPAARPETDTPTSPEPRGDSE